MSLKRFGAVAAMTVALLATTFGGSALASTAGAEIEAVAPDISLMVSCGTNGANESLTRAQILTRAKSWVTSKVPYSQSKCFKNQYGKYRTDCSGFISMAWGLKNSEWTGSIGSVSHKITQSQLKPGDALFVHNSSRQHVALFVKWTGAVGGSAVVYEQYSTGHTAERRIWSAAKVDRHQAIRYDKVR